MDYTIELTTTRNKICSHSIKIKSLDMFLNSMNMGRQGFVKHVRNTEFENVTGFLKRKWNRLLPKTLLLSNWRSFGGILFPSFLEHLKSLTGIIEGKIDQKKLETTNFKILPVTHPKSDAGIKQLLIPSYLGINELIKVI